MKILIDLPLKADVIGKSHGEHWFLCKCGIKQKGTPSARADLILAAAGLRTTSVLLAVMPGVEHHAPAQQ